MFLGLVLLFSPLAVVADLIPLLGDMLRLGITLFSGVIALALSLLTVAVGWIAYRPLLGIPLLLLAIGGIVSMKLFAQHRLAARRPPPIPSDLLSSDSATGV